LKNGDIVTLIKRNIKTPKTFSFDDNPNNQILFATLGLIFSFLLITLSILVLKAVLVLISKSRNKL
jgi:hypothetical protein